MVAAIEPELTKLRQLGLKWPDHPIAKFGE
jgi:hypothetical protein